jgi:hypothetical protein
MLRAPLLVESYAEHRARLAALPPAALQPRRLGESVHVLPVAGVEAVTFSVVDQATCAVLHDAEGSSAYLTHPFHARGREGAEALLAALREAPEALRFVAGHVHLAGDALRIAPISLIFEEGGTRRMLQPWIDKAALGSGLWALGQGERQPVRDTDGRRLSTQSPEPRAQSRERSDRYPVEVLEAVGDLLLLGLRRADAAVTRRWEELHRHGAALGFDRFLRPIATLAATLSARQHALEWEPRPAARALLTTAALARLALDAAE